MFVRKSLVLLLGGLAFGAGAFGLLRSVAAKRSREQLPLAGNSAQLD